MRSKVVPTKLIPVDPIHPDPGDMKSAANVLLDGGLVAFPTETVYGLGANALDGNAVERIFRAKGRPATNPLIVHVKGAEDARELVAEWPDHARALASMLWPGPLTLVFEKKPGGIPDIVTAGGSTIAVRSPKHPVAQALLRACDVPIAAPSANRSTKVSPTNAEHVRKALDGRIELILDAGPTVGGLESTVLDLTGTSPTLLRPGLITRRQLEQIIGPVRLPADSASGQWKSPGMMKTHYSPVAKLLLTNDEGTRLVRKLLRRYHRVGWIPLGEGQKIWFSELIQFRPLPNEPNEYAKQIYAVLHELDNLFVDYIIAQMPPDTEDWRAVRDRLSRAASPAEL